MADKKELIRPPFIIDRDESLITKAENNWLVAVKGSRAGFPAFTKYLQQVEAQSSYAMYNKDTIIEDAAKIHADNVMGYTPSVITPVDQTESPSKAAARDKFNSDILNKFSKILWNAEFVANIKHYAILHAIIYENEPVIESIPISKCFFRFRMGAISQAIVIEDFTEEVVGPKNEVIKYEYQLRKYYEKYSATQVKLTHILFRRKVDSKQPQTKWTQLGLEELTSRGFAIAGSETLIFNSSYVPVFVLPFRHVEGQLFDPLEQIIPMLMNYESSLADQLTLQRKFSRPHLPMSEDTKEMNQDPETKRVKLGEIIQQSASDTRPLEFLVWDSEQKARSESIQKMKTELMAALEIEAKSIGFKDNQSDIPESGRAAVRGERLETRNSHRRALIWKELLSNLLFCLQEQYVSTKTLKLDEVFTPKKPQIDITESYEVLSPREELDLMVVQVQNNIISRKTAAKKYHGDAFPAEQEFEQIKKEQEILANQKYANGSSNQDEAATQTEKQSSDTQEKEQKKAEGVPS